MVIRSTIFLLLIGGATLLTGCGLVATGAALGSTPDDGDDFSAALFALTLGGSATGSNSSGDTSSSGGTSGGGSGGSGGGSGPSSVPGTNTIEEVDISTALGLGNNSGIDPTVQIDTTNDKILIAVRNFAGQVTYVRCDMDLTGCTARDLSTLASNPPAVDYLEMVIAGSYATVAATTTSYGYLHFLRCTLDLVTCASFRASGQINTLTGNRPQPIFDSAADKLRIVTHLTTFGFNRPFTHNTNSNGSGGDGGVEVNTSGTSRLVSGVISPADGKLLVVASDLFAQPALFRCDVDGTGCTSAIDISAGGNTLSNSYTNALVPLIDTKNSKLLVVGTRGGATDTDAPVLFRCEYTGAGCTWTQIDAGQGAGSGHYYTARIDTVNDKLLVAARNNTSTRIGLFRCDLDGSNCAYTALSSTAGWRPQMAVDATNGKLITVYQGTGGRLYATRN